MFIEIDSSSAFSPSEQPILVLCCEEAQCTSLRETVRESGVKNPCVFFTKGDEIIDALVQVLKGAPPPLLCLLSVGTKGLCGLDVLKWIRWQDALSQVSVIVVKSPTCSGPEGAAQAHRLGAQCYLDSLPTSAELRKFVQEAKVIAGAASGHAAFDLPTGAGLQQAV